MDLLIVRLLVTSVLEVVPYLFSGSDESLDLLRTICVGSASIRTPDSPFIEASINGESGVRIEADPTQIVLKRSKLSSEPENKYGTTSNTLVTSNLTINRSTLSYQYRSTRLYQTLTNMAIFVRVW